MKKRPGPAGTSCLTCRRRRKKCDQTRPQCKTCRDGEFECLGYDLLGSSVTYESIGSNGAASMDARGPQDMRGIEEYGETMSPNGTTALSLGWLSLSQLDESRNMSFTPHAQAPIRHSLRSIVEDTDYPPTSGWSEQRHIAPNYRAAESKPLRRLSNRTISLLLAMPPGVSWVPSDVMDMTDFFMDRFERLLGLSFFKPPYQKVLRVRNTVQWRLQHFSSTRWAMPVCSRLLDSLLAGTKMSSEETAVFCQSISQIEQSIFTGPTRSLTAAEVQLQLIESLELALFRLSAGENNTYETLRKYARAFVRIISSDPTLQPASNNSGAVSLAHVLASPSYEIAHFATLDTMCSIAYGLPQVVEYDTSTPPLADGFHHGELTHGCPATLQLLLTELNALSAWKQVGPIRDWQYMERRLKEWSPILQNSTREDSWNSVAQLAVQESWRHTLLTYLYMAICGASSDDPRVKASVRQVFRTVSSVDHELHPIVHAHFFMQYLIAGAFTPNEKYRAIARRKLFDGIATRIWLLHVTNFVPVLDHLWHGAAANGRPVHWCDYTHSRQVTVPVSI